MIAPFKREREAVIAATGTVKHAATVVADNSKMLAAGVIVALVVSVIAIVVALVSR